MVEHANGMSADGPIEDCDCGDACEFRHSRVRHIRLVRGRCGCKHCDQLLDDHAVAFHNWVFCSEACAMSWLEDTLSIRNPVTCIACLENPPRYTGVCLECLNRERAAQYLSAADACVVCSAVFIPVNGEGTCSEPCLMEARRELNHRRRAREVEAFVADVNRYEIYTRDDFTCQLCRLPIDMSLRFPHVMSPTIDHIIPLAAGGTHEPDNVQAAHFGCNAAKGARVLAQ